MKKITKPFLSIIFAVFIASFFACSSDSNDTSKEEDIVTVNAPSFVAYDTDNNTVQLKLTSKYERNKHNYKIYRNTSNDLASKTQIFSETDYTGSSFITYDNTLTESGYYYYWASEIIDGIESDFSASGEVYFTYHNYISAPLSLEVSSENGTISAIWQAPETDNAASYNIYMKDENNYSYELIKNVSTTSAKITSNDNPSGSSILLSSGNKTLVVSAVALTGEESSYSNSCTFNYECGGIFAPKNLKAVIDSTDKDTITLTWDSVTDAEYYKVYTYGSNYAYDSVDYWDELDDCASTSFIFSLSETRSFSNYLYNSVTVTAINNKNEESPYADSIKVNISPSYASASFSNGVITVTWDKPEFGDAVSYDIYVSNYGNENDSPVKIKNVSSEINSTTLSYKDTPTVDGILSTSGDKIVYVIAVNSIGIEASFDYSGTYLANYSVIPAISEIQSSLDTSCSLITLSWDKPDYGDPVEYDIYIRGLYGSYDLEDYKYVKTVTATSATLSSNDVIETNNILDDTINSKIYFAIKSKNALGMQSSFPAYRQSYSNPNPCYVSGYNPHPAPTNPIFELTDDKKIALSWDPVGNADHYIIQYTFAQQESYINKNSLRRQLNTETPIFYNKVVLSKNMFREDFDDSREYIAFEIKAVDKNGKESDFSSLSPIKNVGIIKITDLSNETMSSTKSVSGYFSKGNITNFYCYNLTAGNKYEITWTSKDDEENTDWYAAPISVKGYYESDLAKSDGIDYIVNYEPIVFTAKENGYIILEVENRSSTFGTYTIAIFPKNEN